MEEPIRTSEGDFIKRRRKENKLASELIERKGLTPDTANALLKTRILMPNILDILVKIITSNKSKPSSK